MGTRTKKQSPTVSKAGVWAMLMVIFFAELFFYTWCRVQHVRVGYDTSVARAENQHLLSLQRQLKVELSRLRSPERIATIATEQLGLIVPGPEQMVTIP
ncbi:MAG: cell division protein FtsL [Desulfobacterales bacterium]|nr:cell division protein FtsL [Desulfobacterales bacterium]